ncbi:MAG: BBP7 family outer membrane beta-barrel protein [Gemmataceae bacterium]|nr:BBP7 family outer membrane beta-barrel protein [Gemmataceae bacterium]
MKRRIFACLGSALVGAGVSLAQAPSNSPPPAGNGGLAQADKADAPARPAIPVIAPPAGVLNAAASGCPCASCCEASCGESSPRFWSSVEYLLWWVKDAPMPVSMVTTSAPGDRGVLGAPTTRVLFGGGDQDFGTFSGLRLIVGSWLDREGTVGVEVGGFLLEQRSAPFYVASNPGNGNPLLAFANFNSAPNVNREDGFIGPHPFGTPGFSDAASGSIAISSFSRLWGLEVNGVSSASRGDGFHAETLLGLRYLDLEENLRIAGAARFQSSPQGLFVSDHFQSRTQFYGAQLGFKAGVQRGALSADLVAKLALGWSHEVVTINGASTSDTITGPRNFQGGVYAVPSNIGRQTHDIFAVVPDVQLKVGYDVTDGVRTFIGYNFLYLTSVVRPGDQVDRIVNNTQRLGLPLVGLAQPTPQFNKTDFWAQGISFGLEVRY